MISQSRREFLQNSLTVLGSSFVPALLLNSCLPGRSRPEPIAVDYLGNPDTYHYFQQRFKKIRHFEFLLSSLENSMDSESEAVLIDSDTGIKSTHAVMLLEQGKDIIVTYPLAANLDEYNFIQDQVVRYDRRLGMINPVQFYPSINALGKLIQVSEESISEVNITCHPYILQKDFQVGGLAGTAQPLQRLVSYITGKFPLSVYAGMKDENRVSSLSINYGSFQVRIIFKGIKHAVPMVCINIYIGYTLDIV